MQSQQGWVFIINPIAGNGFAASYADTIKAMIKKHSIDAKLAFTEKRGHATKITRDCVNQGFDHIIGVGGDGTFNEIVQALVNKKGVTFGAVSAGTGNDFITILGFSDHFTEQDWETFFQEHTILMDVGRCNDRYFINGMGLGYDAQVAFENYEAENSRTVKGGGKSKYWWHILKTLVVYKEKEMRITVNDEQNTKKSFLNTIANGRRLAGGFYLTPKAIANDGLLDVCMIDELSVPGRVKELLRVMKQAHTEDEVVNYFSTDKLLFEFDEEVPAHLDGEMYFGSKFDISILPGHLKTIYNPNGSHYFEIEKADK